MDRKEIKYNFPVKNPSPFEKDFEGNYFFYANGYSNLSKSINDFSFDNFVKYIPTGYKTIVVNHRELLIEKGEIVKEWIDKPGKNYINDLNENQFIIYSEKLHNEYFSGWNREVISNVVKKSDSTTADFKSSVWKDKIVCINFAKEFSKNNDCKVLISKVIKSITWR